MVITSMRMLDGPNVHLHRPVLVAQVDLGDLAERETREFPEFNGRLLARLPGLHEHVCGRGTPGGLVERLEGGTYFGHVVEHVALELSEPAGVPAHFGRTRRTADPRVYTIVLECTSAPVMRLLLQTAVDLVDALVEGNDYPSLEGKLAEARRLYEATSLGPSTRAIVAAAERRDIPVTRLNDDSLVQLGYGVHRRLIEAAVGPATSSIAVGIAADKQLTRHLLERAYVPVPAGRLVHTPAEAQAALVEVGGPLAVKPRDGNHGRGVTLGVGTAEEMRQAFERAQAVSPSVVVEEMLQGRDYRVLVVGGRCVAASERIPAHVVGDGHHTVEQLVEAANRDPRRGESHERPLTRIRLDEVAHEMLRRQGLTLSEVPERGRRVQLCATANLSSGGTAIDVTDTLHPEVAAVCERAARAVGLDICGLDLITPDIGAPLPESHAGIVEVNAGPGLRMHLHPTHGAARDVGAAIVDMVLPTGDGRIPMAAITGTNGKTTVARMLAHAWSITGRVVGLTTTDGVYVDGRAIACGDMTGPRSARAVLSDPTVEVAVLETARGGIVRSGLGYDWTDVGVMTNIQADHIGQDGIESIDDLVHIKSLVAERVREGGTIVLNADDERCAALANHPRITRLPRRIVFFSLETRQPRMLRHLEAGGTGYFPRNGYIVEAHGRVLHPICRIADIPSVLGGAAQFNLANALAAVAAGRAMGLDAEVIGRGLASFVPERENPGRVNLFRLRDGFVLLDYGHNPAAVGAIAQMLGRWPGRRLTGILGLPGDRLDDATCEAVAAVAHAFARVIVREDADLRGRRSGELARLIGAEIQRLRPECPCTTIPDEREALQHAVQSMQPGELIVMFYEHYDVVRAMVDAMGAEPVVGGLTALPAFQRWDGEPRESERRHAPRRYPALTDHDEAGGWQDQAHGS